MHVVTKSKPRAQRAQLHRSEASAVAGQVERLALKPLDRIAPAQTQASALRATRAPSKHGIAGLAEAGRMDVVTKSKPRAKRAQLHRKPELTQARALTRPNSFLIFCTLGREIPNSFAIAAPVLPASTATFT
jgi:hypothetical protein